MLVLLLSCRVPESAGTMPPPWAETERLAEEDATALQAAPGLVDDTLRRIAALDRAGPELRALMPGAKAAPAGAGLLAGLPLVVKDNVDVAGFPTTVGAAALAGNVPARDAFVVARVREAGAVVVAKANLSEWANFRSDHSVSGWSAVGGQTQDPYALDRTPCGSSAGSAVAVSAGLAALAIGTETDGSILCPASMAGIVGVKPTIGLVSRDGIAPIAHSQDTAGPMGRSVRDVALLLEVMAAPDPSDPATARRPADLDVHYRDGLRADALAGARIGVARALEPAFDDRVTALLDAAVADLQRLGATVVDTPLAVPDGVQDQELEVLLHEFPEDLDRYLAGVQQGPRSLAEVVAWNEAHADVELRWFGQDLFAKALAHPRADGYAQALAESERATGPDGIDRALAEGGLVAIVAPTVGEAWRRDVVTGDKAWTGGTTQITAVAGYPAVTVPMGAVEGLPIGLTFLAGAFTEGRLLGLAYAYEQGTHHRTPPAFRPTIE